MCGAGASKCSKASFRACEVRLFFSGASRKVNVQYINVCVRVCSSVFLGKRTIYEVQFYTITGKLSEIISILLLSLRKGRQKQRTWLPSGSVFGEALLLYSGKEKKKTVEVSQMQNRNFDGKEQ